MNANLKLAVGAAISVLLAAGCVSEQERRERVAQEKARQEQAERDARERRARLAREAKERAARLAKEREERAKAAIEAYWTGIYENNSKIILSMDLNREDWYKYPPQMLKNWVGSRLNLTAEEQEQGNALLEEFGTKYMPNAYASYEKARERAQEVQQMFNENFPDAIPPSKEDATYVPYCKMIKGLAKVRGIYFRKRDELCHFYLMHKADAISAAELSKVDGSPICVRLLEEMPFGRMPISRYTMSKAVRDKVVEFAKKRAPETYSVMQRLSEERKVTVALYKELAKESRLIDAVRFELSVIACCEKANYIDRMLQKLIGTDLQTLQAEYATMEKDAAAIAKWDHENALKLIRFAEILPSYAADRTKGPLIAANSKMGEFFPCDDILLWHLYATGCKLNGPNYRWYAQYIPKAGGSYLYWYRRWDNIISNREARRCIADYNPIWKDAFKTVAEEFKGSGNFAHSSTTFMTIVDSPDIDRLFSGAHGLEGIEVKKKGLGLEVEGINYLLLHETESPLLKRLAELDGDKGHYSLVVKRSEMRSEWYESPEIAKVAISQ